MSSSNILFLMSGSIACFKACSLVSQLVQQGHDVQTCMSSSAEKFIGPATLEGLTGKPVFTSSFTSGNAMKHIHLGKWADLTILCPASANTINQLANGLTTNIIGEIFLAHDFTKNFLLVPAMNQRMYENPITQKSLSLLKEMGIFVTPTGTGDLACGEYGSGRMLEAETIFQIANRLLEQNTPTQEVNQ